MQSFPLAPMIAVVGVFFLVMLIVVLAVILIKVRTKASLVSALVGMAVFAVCYVIALITSSMVNLFVGNLLIAVILLSLRAGVVEELGRYLAFKVFLRRKNRISDSLLYGLGHGGMEVILVLGLSAVSVLVIGIMINAGLYDSLTRSLDEQALTVFESQVQTISETGVFSIALGGVERIWAVIAHMSFSVIVFCAVRQNKLPYLFVAILLHFGLDCSTYLVHAQLVSPEAFELIVGGIAAVFAAIAFTFARRYVAWSKEQLAPMPEQQSLIAD